MYKNISKELDKNKNIRQYAAICNDMRQNAMICTNTEQGMVLVIALIILLALTSVTVVLMQKATDTMQLALNQQQKAAALTEAKTIAEQAMFNQQYSQQEPNERQQVNSDLFTRPNSDYPINISDLVISDNTDVQLNKINEAEISIDHCPTYFIDTDFIDTENSQTSTIESCSIFTINSRKHYGKALQYSIKVSTGILYQQYGSNVKTVTNSNTDMDSKAQHSDHNDHQVFMLYQIVE